MAEDGHTIHLQTSLSPVWSLAGAVTGAVGVGRDISEIKQLERVKSEFVANVSHELRTPLASILGYSELLLRERPGPLTEVQHEFVQTISESSKRLKLLVDDLLDVSRIDVGNFRMRMDDISLNEIIQRGLEIIKPIAAEHKVEIEANLPSRLPVIEADGERISQVFDNLLSNAVKFSNASGKVHVAVSVDDMEVSVSVRDEGIGIPSEDIPFLFSRFYRATNADPSNRSGTGLGLYICKAIIDGHGGRIAVESCSGCGATFRFWLPKNQASPLDASPDQLVTEIVDRYFTTPQ
jgi:two-component system phosphate regulon sensor histidine kinase PhoR